MIRSKSCEEKMMRYLGNKTNLLNFIEDTIVKYGIEGEVFADLFAGTGAVGDYFKGEYQVISNDFLYYSYVINQGKLLNAVLPEFKKVNKMLGVEDVFAYLNSKQYTPDESYFVYNEYSPKGERMFLQEENAIRVDGIRQDIEFFYKKGWVNDAEYYFLLASLLESVTKVSNTSGTYEAFFKFWESRSQKELILEPIDIKEVDVKQLSKNEVYNRDTNDLVREISGDIAYIDPPYTVTQYASAYHVLETIARYDYPEVRGITGRRVKNRRMSLYSRKKEAEYQFEDLIRQLDFKHILISYSNQGLVPLERLIEIATIFAVDGKVEIEGVPYREYKNHRSSKKGGGQPLKEVLIYFQKETEILKSPLNYPGSKDTIFKKIEKEFPEHLRVFVDMMGGAFNVGINVHALDKVVYNEKNPFIYEVVQWLLDTDKNEQIYNIEKVITDNSLEPEAKEAYQKFRVKYNEEKTPLNLLVLHMYAFQNMIRFNNSGNFNTPVGNSGYNSKMKQRIVDFMPRSKTYDLISGSYSEMNAKQFDADSTLFYFDPPYYVTTASYNDGKRGGVSWDEASEVELLNYLDYLHKNGYKFLLSNVLTHKGQTNELLEGWVNQNGYFMKEIGRAGAKYPRIEVIVKNY